MIDGFGVGLGLVFGVAAGLMLFAALSAVLRMVVTVLRSFIKVDTITHEEATEWWKQ